MLHSLRYVLIQEERNGEMENIIEPNLFGAIIVLSASALVLGNMFVYNLFCYFGTIVKYCWTTLGNSTILGNILLELVLIIPTIISGIVIIFSLKGMGDMLDNVFAKLKNNLKQKDERIKDLEANIVSLKANIVSLKENIVSLKENITTLEAVSTIVESGGIITQQINF